MHDFLKQYEDVIGFVNVIALLVGFIGFVITIYQLRSSAKDSRKISDIAQSLKEQLIEFKNQNAELTVIKESLSTKYIGLFPDFVGYTVELLEGATRKMEIVCDFPCYSYFSDYKQYIEYTNVLREKKASNIQIQLTCPNAINRQKLVTKQFRATEQNWKNRNEIKDKLIEFIRRERVDKTFDEMTIDDFNSYIGDINSDTLKTTFKNNYFEVDQQLPVYYWIVDDARAVFSIPSFTEYDREQGFLTNDAKLINALKMINVELQSKK
ncbi:hypothetical protein [Foetidibacter luteolus]|uniref:hypothetical protein n=1 Tax=Foetidibacter luteolus TaxID=2608880 RepID=UPI00129B9765|nr:hypothetical protein [Foetidibacter luteolus]